MVGLPRSSNPPSLALASRLHRRPKSTQRSTHNLLFKGASAAFTHIYLVGYSSTVLKKTLLTCFTHRRNIITQSYGYWSRHTTRAVQAHPLRRMRGCYFFAQSLHVHDSGESERSHQDRHSVFAHLWTLGSYLPLGALPKCFDQESRGHVRVSVVGGQHADEVCANLRVCRVRDSGAACRRSAVASSYSDAAFIISILAITTFLCRHIFSYRELSERCHQLTKFNIPTSLCFPPSDPSLIVLAVCKSNSRLAPFCDSLRPRIVPPEVLPMPLPPLDKCRLVCAGRFRE